MGTQPNFGVTLEPITVIEVEHTHTHLVSVKLAYFSRVTPG